jgi:hypothetical protein
MQTQKAAGGRHGAIPMGSSSSKKPNGLGRSPAISKDKSEISRRSSLQKQRSQMETIRKRKGH